MTTARQVIAGRTYLISRRCTQRQHLLRPDATIEQAFLYCLGEAVQRYEVTLHGWIAMSNHEHLVITDNKGNFPEFLAHFHKMIAKVVNAYRGRWENLWATEQPNAVWLVNPEDRFDKLIYLLTNPVLDDLVERAVEWPGASSIGLHLGSRTTKTVQRPRLFFRDDGKMPAEVTLKLDRLDGFAHLSDQEWRDKIATAVAEVETQTRAARVAAGRQVFGRRNVLRVPPTDAPRTTEPRRGLRPNVACRDVRGRKRELALLSVFRKRYREALERFRNGERDVEFPEGTYGMLRYRMHLRIRAPVTTKAA